MRSWTLKERVWLCLGESLRMLWREWLGGLLWELLRVLWWESTVTWSICGILSWILTRSLLTIFITEGWSTMVNYQFVVTLVISVLCIFVLPFVAQFAQNDATTDQY